MAESAIPAVTLAAVNAITLALFGLDYYSMLYGFIGALVALTARESMGRIKSMVFVTLSTFIGAAIGNAFMATIGKDSRQLLIFWCAVGGFGAQQVLAAALSSLIRRIDRLGGSS